MFTIYDELPGRRSMSRRRLLQIGALGAGSFSLPSLLEQKALAKEQSLIRNKSVVFLFLQGGPPQNEMWDPKMDAPENVRCCTGAVQTDIAGVQFGGTFEKMARMTDRFTIVRSFHSSDAGHDQMPVLTGRHPSGAVMGAQFTRLAGVNHPRTAMPRHAVLLPEQIEPELQLGNPTGPFTYGYIRENYTNAGEYGGAHQALLLDGGKGLADSLTLSLPKNRFDDRRLLLTQLDNLKRRFDRTDDLAAANSSEQQAVNVLLGGIADAFDLSKEDPRTIAKYDTSELFDMNEWHRGGKMYNNKRNQSRITNLLGKQLLLARRLCEAGCGFVTVHDACWDFHNDGNNPSHAKAMPVLGAQVDHAVAAFLEDVHQRGLSDDILLVISSEMGRAPGKQGNGGSGHWARLTPLLLAGGGLKMGQIVGQTDAHGGEATSKLYGPQHLNATIMRTLIDGPQARLLAGLPSELIETATDAEPILEMHG